MNNTINSPFGKLENIGNLLSLIYPSTIVFSNENREPVIVEWIDEDESLEFSDHELETANVSFSQNGQQICESQGLNSLKEKLNDIKPKLSVI